MRWKIPWSFAILKKKDLSVYDSGDVVFLLSLEWQCLIEFPYVNVDIESGHLLYINEPIIGSKRCKDLAIDQSKWRRLPTRRRQESHF